MVSLLGPRHYRVFSCKFALFSFCIHVALTHTGAQALLRQYMRKSLKQMLFLQRVYCFAKKMLFLAKTALCSCGKFLSDQIVLSDRIFAILVLCENGRGGGGDTMCTTTTNQHQWIFLKKHPIKQYPKAVKACNQAGHHGVPHPRDCWSLTRAGHGHGHGYG